MSGTGQTEWITVPEFIDQHRRRLGRSWVYERIRDGTIPSLRIGRKILVARDALDRLAEEGNRQNF